MSDQEKTPDQIRLEKLAELQDIAKRRRARVEVDDEAALDKELARARLIDKFEDEHGAVGVGIAVFELPSQELVIVKKPASATYRKFQDSKAQSSEAAAAFVKPCVLHPSKERWAELLEEFPAVLPRVALGCAKLAGFRDDEKS